MADQRAFMNLPRHFGRRYNKTMTAERMIVVDPEVMNGTPCFRGTRVPFKNLMDYLEGGHSLGAFLDQFPTITREMAVQALQEAQESLLDRIA
ncbi:MAG: DUF433 domain-containing protein [Candidatus Solibacter sp.]